MLEFLLGGGTADRRKTVADIWNVVSLRGSDLYGLGLPQKMGPNSSALNFSGFTKVDTDVKDVFVTAGSTVKLTTSGLLYGSGDNNSGCFGLGTTGSYLNQWVNIPNSKFDATPAKLGNCGSSLSTVGVITTSGKLYMAGRRNAMGLGVTSDDYQSSWSNVANDVLDFASNDSKFTIITKTTGFAFATGAGNTGTQGMYGNGRNTTYNASFEGTPTTANTTAINFTRVFVTSGCTVGITASGDMYVTGCGWKLVGGVPNYTNVATDYIYTFVKLASNVNFVAIGGSGGGGTWHGFCIAYTTKAGLTYYVGTNYQGVACVGATEAAVSFYATPTAAPYRLIGDSTFSWGGVYNGTAYNFSVYDTSDGLGMAGNMGTFSNLTGTMQIMMSVDSQ